MIDQVQQILRDDVDISNISIVGNNCAYSGKYYYVIFSFALSIGNQTINIVMGIPETWDRNLIDIYVENYQASPYIPHMGSKGLLCLFDLEGVLIEKQLQGIVYQSIERAKKILAEGIEGSNREDFVVEFSDYWNRLPNVKSLKSMVLLDNEIKTVIYSNDRSKLKRKNKETYSGYLKRTERYWTVCADKSADLSMYKNMGSIRKGIYIPIEVNEYIYPPDWREELKITYINGILKQVPNQKRLCKQLNNSVSEQFFMFCITQPNHIQNIFGAILVNYKFDVESKSFAANSSRSTIIPLWVTRCDKDFIIDRGGLGYTIDGKKVLLIGCGSIGGYLTNELLKSGINNLTLVDDDIFKEENVYRHLLGMECIGKYKSKALKEHFNNNIPYAQITAYEEKIEDIMETGSIDLLKYDLIISAVGNHNLNRWLNEVVYSKEINTPVIYLWNEVLGIGNHAAVISSQNKGCYECFFGSDEDSIYDRTSYCEKRQVFTKRVLGCGTSFVPFSSSNSLQTVLLGMEEIRGYFEKRKFGNRLVSIKGDDYYLKKAGYDTSRRYVAQEEKEKILLGSEYMHKRCPICGKL